MDALSGQLDDVAGGDAVTVALWCVLIAGLLPYVATAIAKAGADYDNRDPRAWLAQQQGYRRRASAAATNGFEVLPLFAAAVLIAQLLHAPQSSANLLAIGFIVARGLHLACYLLDRATLRSIAWLLGLLCVIGLFVISAWAGRAAAAFTG
ncbi:MAG TPA: MAPEG family protein [Steroidobacteraceae bacterium]|nr:MAPEG family protein [Steroidobacteraceae bacterium]